MKYNLTHVSLSTKVLKIGPFHKCIWWSSHPLSTTCILVQWPFLNLKLLPWASSQIHASGFPHAIYCEEGCWYRDQFNFEYVFSPFISLCHDNQSVGKNGVFDVHVLVAFSYFLLKERKVFTLLWYPHDFLWWLVTKIILHSMSYPQCIISVGNWHVSSKKYSI